MSSFITNASFNVEDVIGTTLTGGTAGSYKNANRVPMSFTSTRRLQKLNVKFNELTKTPATSQDFTTYLGLYPPDNKTQYELPVIQMAVNPNSISWKQPKRITKRDTQKGSIFFHFTNNKKQNNDILTLDFRGNTGNIDRVSDLTSNGGILGTTGESTGATQKLLIWHNLWDLTREQMLLDDNTKNEFLIIYSSQAMPVEIMLIGFFSSTLEWSDTAEKPNSRDYTFSFTVERTMPNIDDITKEINTYILNP